MPNLPRTINRLKNPRDLWLFLQILAMLARLPGLIRRERLPDLLNRLDPGVYPGPRDWQLLLKTVGFTDTLLRYRFFQQYGKCLMRTLLLFHFLRRQGWPVGIRFGVRKTAEGDVSPESYDETRAITGHSWLVLGGEPFLEESLEKQYVKTFSYPDINTND